MKAETVIRKAAFNPAVKQYWVFSSVLLCVLTVIGIPFLIIWLPIALLMTGRYLRSLECVLTDRAVKLKSGVLFRVEKTIPLDKITDLGMMQGPLMRAMGLERLTVETAGSSAPGALASIIGVVDARGFRDAVMEQKEKLAGLQVPMAGAGALAALNPGGASAEEGAGQTLVSSAEARAERAETLIVLKDIRDVLSRIEQRLD